MVPSTAAIMSATKQLSILPHKSRSGQSRVQPPLKGARIYFTKHLKADNLMAYVGRLRYAAQLKSNMSKLLLVLKTEPNIVDPARKSAQIKGQGNDTPLREPVQRHDS